MVLLRLVHEGTAMRIRHRALLDILAEGSYDFDAYRRRYVELLERDREALVAKTMLSPENFAAIFQDWLKEDVQRYGNPAITVSPKQYSKRAKRRG